MYKEIERLHFSSGNFNSTVWLESETLSHLGPNPAVSTIQRDQIKPWVGGAVTTALTQNLLKGLFVFSRPWQSESSCKYRGKIEMMKLLGSVINPRTEHRKLSRNLWSAVKAGGKGCKYVEDDVPDRNGAHCVQGTWKLILKHQWFELNPCDVPVGAARMAFFTFLWARHCCRGNRTTQLPSRMSWARKQRKTEGVYSPYAGLEPIIYFTCRWKLKALAFLSFFISLNLYVGGF